MSGKTYTMSTGLLVFRSKPNVTFLVSVLFAPFHLSSKGGEGREKNTRRIHVTPTCPPIWWHDLADSLRDYANMLCIRYQRDASANDLLNAIALHFGGGDIPSLMEGIDFSEPVQASDLAMLCRGIPDGNNIEGVIEMGSYHGDKPWPCEAGGWVKFESSRLTAESRTFSMLHYFVALDRSLAARNAFGVAEILGEIVADIIDGVADPVLAQKIKADLSRIMRIETQPESTTLQRTNLPVAP